MHFNIDLYDFEIFLPKYFIMKYLKNQTRCQIL
jgi:hypothetical protein